MQNMDGGERLGESRKNATKNAYMVKQVCIKEKDKIERMED